MEAVAVAESNGDGDCMVGVDRGASAAPVELRPQDTVDETDDTLAEQPCEHFSIRGYVALVQKKDPKFCSLSQIFHDQQQCDERHNSLCPFSVAKFRRWDCRKCLDKAKIPDHRTTSRTVSMKQNGASDGCSISFVRSTLVPTSVDFKSLFSCTQQSSQGKNADRSSLLKSTPESNSKCNSPSGKKRLTKANTDPPTKDLQGSSYNHVATANISGNASVDVTALPKGSQIRENKEGNGMAIPPSPKLSEGTIKPNAKVNGKTQEILTVGRDITNVPEPLSGPKDGHVCNNGPCEAALKRTVESNCKKKKKKKNKKKKKKDNKPTCQVSDADIKFGWRKQKKVRLLSEIINTDQAGGSRSDIEVNHGKVADLCEDDRSTDDVIPVSHQAVGEIWSKTTKDRTKYQGDDIVDDGSSLMNWMKRIPKKLRTKKKDSEHKDFDSSAANSKSTVNIFASKDMHHDFLSSVGKLSKKKMLSTTSTQQGDENIQNNNLERNVQSTDDMSQMDSDNSTQRSLSNVKTTSLSKRKMPSTANVQHDDAIPVSHQTVGEILLKTAKNKTKYKGVDVVDEGSSLMNWMKKIPKKLRTEKKDSEHKDFDSSAANSKSAVDKFASKDVHHDFVSSVGKLRKRKMLPTTSAQQGDENIKNNNPGRNMHNTDDMSQIESENSTQRSLSKGKSMSLSKRKIPSTTNAQHGDENTENNTGKRTILRTDDQCQVEYGDPVQRRLAKVSPGKHGIQNVTALEQKPPKKRKKQKQESMHEKKTIIDDIPMDIVELLVRSQDGRPLITETGSSDISHTQSKITEDEDCTIIAAEDGPSSASTVLDTTCQQKSLASESNQKALQNHVASITQATSMHPLKLQIHGHLTSCQEQQTHLCMGEVVTIAASSPLLSQHKDQSIAEAPADCWSHKGAKKLMWDSFKTAPKDSSTATCGAQFRSSVQAVDLTSTHVVGASNNYSTHQPVISAVDHYTSRAVNQVQARSFPSTMSTVESGNLCDRINAGQSGFYPRDTMPATHLLRLTESSMLTGFPNYEGSNRNQMEFQLRKAHYAHNQYRGSASTSYGSNLNGKVPLTLEDLSRHQLQQNLHKPLRPHPRVGVLSSLLQKEIANWSDTCGTQSGYKIGVSKGIPSFDMNRRENIEALNSGTFSARWNALQLGSVSPSADYFSVRNSTAQSWIRGQGKITNPLDRLVRQDICVTNRNPSDFTTISDDNEYIREGI